jgi:hypothetical protein
MTAVSSARLVRASSLTELRAAGRLVVASRKIFVLPRRWQRAGIVRQTLRNWWLTGLAGAGVHPDRLAHRYPVHGL